MYLNETFRHHWNTVYQPAGMNASRKRDFKRFYIKHNLDKLSYTWICHFSFLVSLAQPLWKLIKQFFFFSSEAQVWVDFYRPCRYWRSCRATVLKVQSGFLCSAGGRCSFFSEFYFSYDGPM